MRMGCGLLAGKCLVWMFLLSIVLQDPCCAEWWMVQERPSNQVFPPRRMSRGGKYMRFGRSPFDFDLSDIDRQSRHQLTLQKLLQRQDHPINNEEPSRNDRKLSESDY